MTLFTNKYFPKSFDEFVGNEEIKQLVIKLIKDNIPNLIISGSQGIGKSTLCMLMMMEYYGEKYQDFILKIYGSIERSKDTFSEYVDKKKKSSSTEIEKCSLFISKTMEIPNNKCRTIIIYDFENMMEGAQQTLKSIMEEKSNRVRFIFICSDASSINSALQSRTTPLYMNQLTKEDIINKLKYISYMEGYDGKELDGETIIPHNIYETLFLLSNNNLRSAINYHQIYLLSLKMEYNNKKYENLTYNEKIDFFHRIFNIPHVSIITDIINSKSSNYNLQSLKHLLDNGFNPHDILDITTKILQNVCSNKSNILIDRNIKQLNIICNVYKTYLLYPNIIHIYNSYSLLALQ